MPKIIDRHDYEHDDIMKKYPEFAKEDIYTLDKCTPNYHFSVEEQFDWVTCLLFIPKLCVYVCCPCFIPCLCMTHGWELKCTREEHVKCQTNIYTYKLDMTKLPPDIVTEINEKLNKYTNTPLKLDAVALENLANMD